MQGCAKPHIIKILCFVFVLLFSLGIAAIGFAYDVQVEIILLGDYPDTALPPGEAFSNIYRIDNWKSYKYKASLEAKSNPGWIFVGWEFDDGFYTKHQKPMVFEVNDQDQETKLWTTNSFELFDTIKAKAVYAYVGSGSVYDELIKMNPVIVSSSGGEANFHIRVYEHDLYSVDGDYGSLFCYPYDYSNDMNIPDGATILLAVLPKNGYHFTGWYVFKEGRNGFDQVTSNVLVITVGVSYSIDAIFEKIP